MHDHGQILELAAAAIDFELEPADRAQLDAALDSCPLCRRQASAMRATATILGRASDIGTPGRVRDVVMGAALRGRSRSSDWRPLLAASLSILVVLGGAAVFVGSRGSNVGPSASPPAASPVQTAVALASPTATPSAAESLAPSAVSSPLSIETTAPDISPTPDDNGLLRAGDIAAMVTDGRLVIRTQPRTGADSAIYKTRIYPGQRVLILDGPVDASGYPWFHVRLGAIDGWAAGAGLDGERWLAPVRNGLIAFVRQAPDGSTEGIYTVTADGVQSEGPLFSDPAVSRYGQLTWSPDGRRLAFVATLAATGNGSSEVFVINADGSNLVQVTRNDVDDDSPAWSPDGTRLAVRVAQVDPSAPGDSNIAVTPVDTPGVTVLGHGANPVWSPDGQQIAMTVVDGSSTRIWTQSADGSNRRQITTVAVASAPPVWSPDGQSLAFISSGLFLVDVASGSVGRVASDPAWAPSWSAAGTIAFVTPGSASPGVFVVDPDGSALDRIWGDPGLHAVPVWSPDGRRLLVIDAGTNPTFGVLDRDAGTLAPIAGDGAASSPAWQPLVP